MNTIVKILKEEDGWTYTYKEFGKTRGVRIALKGLGDFSKWRKTAERQMINTVAMMKHLGKDRIDEFDKVLTKECPTKEEIRWAEDNVKFEDDLTHKT